MANNSVYPKSSSIDFVAVEYRSFKPARVAYRATINRPGWASLVFEQRSWEQLFALIDSMYPHDYDLPDEIDTVVYGKHFKVISNG